MFVEASIIVGAILCAKAAAVTYAYAYQRDRFDAECERCERATRGLSWKKKEEEEEEEEPVAPKRMKDVKRGRSFKKMFSGKKEKETKKRRNAGGGEKET